MPRAPWLQALRPAETDGPPWVGLSMCDALVESFEGAGSASSMRSVMWVR
jgi:hypothetical protein